MNNNDNTIMPLDVDVKGEASVSRMASVAKIFIMFRTDSLSRNEASAALSRALEQVVDGLDKISSHSHTGNPVFRTTSDGPVTSWRVGTLHYTTETTKVPSTKVYQDNHTVISRLQLIVHDLQVLEKIANIVAKTPCISNIRISWSLKSLETVRLKTEVHELAAKDALNKATAIASSIGFTTVVAREVIVKDPERNLVSDASVFEESGQHTFGYQSRRRLPHGCFLEDYEDDIPTGTRGDGKWIGQDDAGSLDVWKLVFAPKEITMYAKVEAKFSATSSTGWVYEEFNKHRFLTS